ncbi:MAG: glycosyltransferase family 2 protein [bacterium]
MKLIIQIPCLNEEENLPRTLADLPEKIEGIDRIELLVIDDGSTDRTVELAKKSGVHHIVSFPRNRGLARAFAAGMDASLKLGADIIVNTDADNQYVGSYINELVKPIMEGKADMVVGDRNTDMIPHFSPLKKKLQKLGSWTVRRLSRSDIPDTTSGFRAYSREAAIKINILTDFTYTLESIIQAGNNYIDITHVPVEINPVSRESRLFSSIPAYLKRSVATIVRVYTMYQPLKVFSYLGGFMLLVGFAVSLRFFISFFQHPELSRHLQSLIFVAICVITGAGLMLVGLVSDLISRNRQLIEDTLCRVKKLELFLMYEKKK